MLNPSQQHLLTQANALLKLLFLALLLLRRNTPHHSPKINARHNTVMDENLLSVESHDDKYVKEEIA
jgi:hypothetical protein